jgi:beta-glucosidase/6-phospho-beta-glucosidase/beta-galactosidase
VFGWYVITRQYWERYRRPVMHTEINKIGGGADESPCWLWKQFFNVDHLRSEGVPVLGFTWFSLIDQVDWDIALRQERGLVNPVGLYDLDRRPRVAAPAYRRMIQEFGNQLK